jgi:hypothetical protein
MGFHIARRDVGAPFEGFFNCGLYVAHSSQSPLNRAESGKGMSGGCGIHVLAEAMRASGLLVAANDNRLACALLLGQV